MSDSTQDIERDIARTRAELQATIDQLHERLDPRTIAQESLDDAKAAAADLRRRATGDVRPLGEPEPTTRGWAVLGAGAAVAVAFLAAVIRKL